MRRVTTVAELQRLIAQHRGEGATVALVPTMGALHEGHLALVRKAADEADVTVVSIFVNPRQFDRADDLAAYPRSLDDDEEALRGLGEAAPDLVYAPDVDEMYPSAPAVTVAVDDSLGDRLCGASRPGHFDGVATVVTKLFNQVQPDLAVFGRKDRQQLQIIRRLVADLDVPVRVLPVSTVRDPDGLAMSSRNRRLTTKQRADARVLSAALAAAVEQVRAARDAGETLRIAELLTTMHDVLADAPDARLDYLEVVDPGTLGPPRPEVAATSRLIAAVAAFFGEVRLIDNVELGDIDDEDALLAGVGRSTAGGR